MSTLKLGRYDYAAFLSFFAYAAGSVAVPVALVAIATELDFTLSQGGMGDAGLLHLARTVAMVIAMLGCGIVAGRFGKRLTLGWSVALMGLGVLLCAAAPGYGLLLIALAIAGLGEGVIEGLATPFVDALHPKEPGRYINFAHSFWSIGVVVAVLATGGLISLGVSWRWPIAGAAVFGLIAAGMILYRRSSGDASKNRYPETREPVHLRAIWQRSRLILKTGRFWRYFAAMFFAGGGEFGLTFWSAAFIQLHLHPAAWAGGVGTACFAGGMFMGRALAGRFIAQKQLKPLLLATALAGAVLSLALPLVGHLGLMFPLLFVVGLSTAPYWPSVQAYAVGRMPDRDSTLLYIGLSCAGVPGCGVLTWAMGHLADLTSLRLAFLLVPASFFALLVLIATDGRRQSTA